MSPSASERLRGLFGTLNRGSERTRSVGDTVVASSRSSVQVQIPDGLESKHLLSIRQLKILQVIADSIHDRGYPPSMREIGDALGLPGTSSVAHQVSALRDQGYLYTLRHKGPLYRDVAEPQVVEVRTAGWLLAATARMLPAGERGRYWEEFRSELAELAQVGGCRRVQVAYAARQMRSAWSLRIELRAPSRRRAGP